ncbi:hypothetical protein C8R44DRAFT_741675 [Mycena epipterygia]|nr:hypothetical protein C8R44DRAFT_741675 [Mycena epipterygia]
MSESCKDSQLRLENQSLVEVDVGVHVEKKKHRPSFRPGYSPERTRGPGRQNQLALNVVSSVDGGAGQKSGLLCCFVGMYPSPYRELPASTIYTRRGRAQLPLASSAFEAYAPSACSPAHPGPAAQAGKTN